MAEKLSGALGRVIEFVDVPPEAMRQALTAAGLPVWQADSLIEDPSCPSATWAAN